MQPEKMFSLLQNVASLVPCSYRENKLAEVGGGGQCGCSKTQGSSPGKPCPLESLQAGHQGTLQCYILFPQPHPQGEERSLPGPFLDVEAGRAILAENPNARIKKPGPALLSLGSGSLPTCASWGEEEVNIPIQILTLE